MPTVPGIVRLKEDRKSPAEDQTDAIDPKTDIDCDFRLLNNAPHLRQHVSNRSSFGYASENAIAGK
jgi:hypothetical protein